MSKCYIEGLTSDNEKLTDRGTSMVKLTWEYKDVNKTFTTFPAWLDSLVWDEETEWSYPRIIQDNVLQSCSSDSKNYEEVGQCSSLSWLQEVSLSSGASVRCWQKTFSQTMHQMFLLRLQVMI